MASIIASQEDIVSAQAKRSDSTVAAAVRTSVVSRLPVLLLGHAVPASFFLVMALARTRVLASLVATQTQTGDRLATAAYYAAFVHKGAAALFMALIAICFVVRSAPLRAARDPRQIAAALLGSFILTAVAMAPETQTSPLVTIVASVIMAAGTLFTGAALVCLGRSFSITPEARRLVTGGLYRYVRHPMYLGEMTGNLGLVLQALSPLSIAIFAVFVLLQLKRMDYEESVLRSVFPDYESYRSRTARLVPGVY